MEPLKKTKKIKQKRQKLKLFRSSEPLKSIFMWGINYSFSQLCHVTPRILLMKDDYRSHIKIKVNNHLFNEDCMPKKYKFKEYCPIVFHSLREKLNVNPKDYLESFTSAEPFWDTAVGRSGSKFMVTQNRHYIVKTICSEDVEEIHNLLGEYYVHVVETKGKTLLPHYLGMYRISYNDQETYFLVMRNIFSPRLTISSKYDLKGNNLEREANEKEKNKANPTLKDSDFVNNVGKLYIGTEEKNKFLEQLKRDIKFLEENNLIDYSIIVGIHNIKTNEQTDFGLDHSQTTITAHGNLINQLNALEKSFGDDTEENLNMSDVKNTLNLNTSLTINFPNVNHEEKTSEKNSGEEIKNKKKTTDNAFYEGKEFPSAGDGRGTIDTNLPPIANNMANRKSITTNLFRRITLNVKNTMEVDEEVDVSDDLCGYVSVPARKSSEYNPLSSSGGSPDNAFSYENYNLDESNMSNLTPPESPRMSRLTCNQFNGVLLPDLEYYGIVSSQDKGCVYFISLIDILNRFDMRKKTFKAVKIGNDQVRSEDYARRLYDFISTRIE